MGKEKRQRQKAARAARIQAEQKKRSRQENIKRLGIGVGMALVLVAVLVTCSLRGGEEGEEGPGELSADYQEYRDKPTACGAEAPPPMRVMRFGRFVHQGITAESSVTALLR